MPKKPAKSINRAKAEEAVEAISTALAASYDHYLLNELSCMMLPTVGGLLDMLRPDGTREGSPATPGTCACKVLTDAVKLTSYLGVVDMESVATMLTAASTGINPAALLPAKAGCKSLTTLTAKDASENMGLAVSWAQDMQEYLYKCRINGFAGAEPPAFPVDKVVTEQEYGKGAFEVRDYHHHLGMDIRDAAIELFDMMGSEFSKRVIAQVSKLSTTGKE